MKTTNSFILWLPSWYPNELAPFDGDFIQRHAQAASLYNTIYVIKLVADLNGTITRKVKTDIKINNNLTEHVVYFKRPPSWMGKWWSVYKEMRLYRQAVRKCIRELGLQALLHVHILVKAGLVALWMRRKYGVPFLTSEHWTIYQPGSPGAFDEKPGWFRRLSRLVLRRSEALVTVSDDLGRRINQIVLPKKFQVVPNVVDSTYFFYRPISNAAFRFIHVSDMSFQKNIIAIIENFAAVVGSFPTAELMFVGKVDSRALDLASHMGLANRSIFFLGEVPYRRVAEEVQNSNALIMFSVVENQPCAVLEALCCGRPVISSPVGGIPEVIDTTNGVLTDGQARLSLADAMKQVINEYDRFDGAQIARIATSKYSYTVVGEMFARLYGSVRPQLEDTQAMAKIPSR